MHLAPASHRCKPEDPRAVLKKKRERDVLKRKNYEIKTLKDELTDKEKHLFQAQNKLYAVTHSQVSISVLMLEKVTCLSLPLDYFLDLCYLLSSESQN